MSSFTTSTQNGAFTHLTYTFKKCRTTSLSATLDYGHAIKDLCAANIFGDLFTKILVSPDTEALSSMTTTS